MDGILNPWHGQGFPPLVWIAQRPVQPGLKHFQEWGSVQVPCSVVFTWMLKNAIQRNSCWETKEEKKKGVQTDQSKTKYSNFWKHLALGKDLFLNTLSDFYLQFCLHQLYLNFCVRFLYVFQKTSFTSMCACKKAIKMTNGFYQNRQLKFAQSYPWSQILIICAWDLFLFLM